METAFRSLALTLLLCFAMTGGKVFAGGIPVFDAAQEGNAIAQLGKMAEEISHLQTQIQNQVAQIENMVLNNIAPATYMWQQADQSVKKLLALQQQFEQASVGQYLEKYKDINFYKNNPYNDQYAAQLEARQEALKNQAMTLSSQQETLNQEAQKLNALQANTQTAKGRLEALQYANQLAAMQNNQILQVRALMMQEQAARNAEAQMRADREAKARAVSDHMKTRAVKF